MKIKVGVTHQIRINGDNAWIKLEVEDEFTSTDKLGRDVDDFMDNLALHVNEKVIEICQQTAETVERYTGGN